MRLGLENLIVSMYGRTEAPSILFIYCPLSIDGRRILDIFLVDQDNAGESNSSQEFERTLHAALRIL